MKLAVFALRFTHMELQSQPSIFLLHQPGMCCVLMSISTSLENKLQYARPSIALSVVWRFVCAKLPASVPTCLIFDFCSLDLVMRPHVPRSDGSIRASKGVCLRLILHVRIDSSTPESRSKELQCLGRRSVNETLVTACSWLNACSFCSMNSNLFLSS